MNGFSPKGRRAKLEMWKQVPRVLPVGFPRQKSEFSFLKRLMAFVISFTFVFSLIVLPPRYAHAQLLLNLPVPGTLVPLSPGFTPTILRGIKVFPDQPLQFNFIVDQGDGGVQGEALKKETEKLIKYFLASLTVPEKDLWVNLSPYEKDRIIPQEFGTTEMGRDLLAQDYLLKQLTASLMYPENELGKNFWQRVYKRAYDLYGTTDIPVNTFNKVWIIPQKAVIYEQGDAAFVVKSHLKVMLEEDYLLREESLVKSEEPLDTIHSSQFTSVGTMSSEIIREIILPELEKEVNEGQNFASLRQIYNSMILATWYKRNLKDSLLSRKYVGQSKVEGVDVDDKGIKEKIYAQYLEAFKKGVYNYIREEHDPQTDEIVPRKYFSGGTNFDFAQLPADTYNENGKRGDFQSLMAQRGAAAMFSASGNYMPSEMAASQQKQPIASDEQDGAMLSLQKIDDVEVLVHTDAADKRAFDERLAELDREFNSLAGQPKDNAEQVIQSKFGEQLFKAGLIDSEEEAEDMPRFDFPLATKAFVKILEEMQTSPEQVRSAIQSAIDTQQIVSEEHGRDIARFLDDVWDELNPWTYQEKLLYTVWMLTKYPTSIDPFLTKTLTLLLNLTQKSPAQQSAIIQKVNEFRDKHKRFIAWNLMHRFPYVAQIKAYTSQTIKAKAMSTLMFLDPRPRFTLSFSEFAKELNKQTRQVVVFVDLDQILDASGSEITLAEGEYENQYERLRDEALIQENSLENRTAKAIARYTNLLKLASQPEDADRLQQLIAHEEKALRDFQQRNTKRHFKLTNKRKYNFLDIQSITKSNQTDNPGVIVPIDEDYSEDRYVDELIALPHIVNPGMSHGRGRLMAAIDGSGGMWTAQHIQDHLQEYFEEALLKTNGDVPGALKITVARFNELTYNLGSIATLSIVYVPEDESRAYTAYLGDSPIIIIDKDGTRHVSREHNARTNQAERQAAMARGAKYDEDQGRISGAGTSSVQMTRFLGGGQKFGAIIDRSPEIGEPIELGENSVILLSSDGLFETGTMQTKAGLDKRAGEMMDLVKQEAMADQLVSFASFWGSIDDITVIISKKGDEKLAAIHVDLHSDSAMVGRDYRLDDTIVKDDLRELSTMRKLSVLFRLIPFEREDTNFMDKLRKGSGAFNEWQKDAKTLARTTLQDGDFGRFDSWDEQVAALSYYLYGEILTEGEFLERLSQSNPEDIHALEVAPVVFGAISLMLQEKDSFSIRELMKRFRQKLTQSRSRVVNILAELYESQSLPASTDALDHLGVFPDADINLLKRAVNMSAGNISFDGAMVGRGFEAALLLGSLCTSCALLEDSSDKTLPGRGTNEAVEQIIQERFWGQNITPRPLSLEASSYIYGYRRLDIPQAISEELNNSFIVGMGGDHFSPKPAEHFVAGIQKFLETHPGGKLLVGLETNPDDTAAMNAYLNADVDDLSVVILPGGQHILRALRKLHQAGYIIQVFGFDARARDINPITAFLREKDLVQEVKSAAGNNLGYKIALFGGAYHMERTPQRQENENSPSMMYLLDEEFGHLGVRSIRVFDPVVEGFDLNDVVQGIAADAQLRSQPFLLTDLGISPFQEWDYLDPENLRIGNERDRYGRVFVQPGSMGAVIDTMIYSPSGNEASDSLSDPLSDPAMVGKGFSVGEKGVWFLNRPVGADTERPVYNLGEFKGKDKVTWGEASEFIAQDQAELEAIAKEMTAATGQQHSVQDAIDKIADRMEHLLQEGLKADRLSHDYHVLVNGGFVPITGTFAKWFYTRPAWQKYFRYGIKDVEGRLYGRGSDHQAAPYKEIFEQTSQRVNILEGGRYDVFMSRAFEGQQDVVLYYWDSDGKKRVLRLNAISIALARMGIFYKGEPADDLFTQRGAKYWDQAYPSSPRAFYERHMTNKFRGIDLKGLYPKSLQAQADGAVVGGDSDRPSFLDTLILTGISSDLSAPEYRSAVLDRITEKFGNSVERAEIPVESYEYATQGGSARIFKDPNDDTIVYKRSSPPLDKRVSNKELLLREAAVLVELNKRGVKNIPQVLAIGVTLSGEIWLKLKGIKFDSISSVMRGFTVPQRLDVFIKVVQTLQSIHDAGYVHNDVNASNIVINQAGEVLLIDFGIASPVGTDMATRGTKGYVPLEWVRVPVSDIYSLGLLFKYYFLGKEPPHPFKLLSEGKLPEMDLESSGLKQLVQNMLELNQEKRSPKTMAQVAQELTKVKDYFEKKLAPPTDDKPLDPVPPASGTGSDSFESDSAMVGDWLEGDIIEHAKFGRGVIKGKPTRDGERIVVVRFGNKHTLALSFAEAAAQLKYIGAPASPTTPDKGGIDLNPAGLEIETQGQGAEFPVPTLEQLENMDFNGLVPVIYKIVPANIPLILGENSQADTVPGA
jgi:serine/threonine protein kinase/serine/threonine protein phosphatase PrpC